MTEHRVRVLLEEELIDRHVHGGNDLLRVADQLAIQVLVELVDVRAIQV